MSDLRMLSLEDWLEAQESLARERNGAGPDDFPAELGLEPAALHQFATHEGRDTIATHLSIEAIRAYAVETGVGEGLAAGVLMASCLSTHTQMGIELGIWLVREGIVKP